MHPYKNCMELTQRKFKSVIKWFNDFKWIIKYGSLTNEFNLFLCKQGSEIIDELETKLSDLDLNESYILARKILISEIKYGGGTTIIEGFKQALENFKNFKANQE